MGDPYPGTENFILQLDLDGYSEPASLVSHAYRDFNSYNTSIYTRGELFFHQLRYIVGDDAMRRILRTFYERWRLKHVNEEAFRRVAEEVSGLDLSTFFGEFLHGTPLYDYAAPRTRRSLSSSITFLCGTRVYLTMNNVYGNKMKVAA